MDKWSVWPVCEKKCLQGNQFPLKCFLAMVSAPAHPSDLEDALLAELNFITVKFLPPDTTPLIKPIDQNVIENFEELYINAMFRRSFHMTSDIELSLRQFWKKSISTFPFYLIDKSWQRVNIQDDDLCLKLSPRYKHERDFEELGPFSDDPIHVV